MFLALAALASWAASSRPKTPVPAVSGGGESYFVERVIDGDTIVLSNRRQVRLIGVDCPEIAHRPGQEDEPFGRAAQAFTRKEVAGKAVWLEPDVEPFDKYRRTLAYVWYEAGGKRVLLNRRLTEEGLALALQYGRSQARLPELRQAMRSAEKRRAGLWSDPDFASRFIRKHHFIEEFGAEYLARRWLERQTDPGLAVLARSAATVRGRPKHWIVSFSGGSLQLEVAKRGGEIRRQPE